MPTISTFPPPHHDVDWFYLDEDGKWKIFDWRRCNLLENMLHYCNQGEFQIIFKDMQFIVDYDHMVMHHQISYYKIRRESSIVSRQIKIQQGKWSYYNGQTWIQYEKVIQNQLEDLMVKGEPLIIMYVNNKQYVFDLEQNVQVEPIDDKGLNKRKIITRQWMNTHQLQEFCKIRKQQELTYIRERKALEEYMKLHQHRKKVGGSKKANRLGDLGISPDQEKQERKQQKSQQQHQQQQQIRPKDECFKMIEHQKQPDPKQLEEWNLLIEKMKEENDENNS
ncbi:unnamed protein product (macronuclear) [Paramecium tetraurelia]|uniref:WWE domain-containing protein n=1 Tax=Paramecium tetraurelia TaxID=5888 RepID=A0E645_PARTE|nr:uncharacterized protein GSPATT00003625001 [Paramecium tetraurelia]CAK90762.1 unnamed protein product [Paramecium tetraurelia]|eukprot:XP_001458159.1 hypothetical protein (macronuclear) [Paramecium tetraurelia strain d4-2]